MSTNLVEVVKDFKKPVPIEKELLELYKKSNFSGSNKIIQVLEKGYDHIDNQSVQSFLDKALKSNNNEFNRTLDEGLSFGDPVEMAESYQPETSKKVVAKSVAFDTKLYNEERWMYEVEYYDNPIGASFKDTSNLSKFNPLRYCSFNLIVETKLNEYNRIPPAHIIQSEIKLRNDFDELVVLEPEVEKVEIPIITDPILCGKINQFPDSYFLVDAWIEDVDLKSLLNKNANKIEEL